jgi:hypothetical protein
VLRITKEERRIERLYLVRKYTIKPVNKVEMQEQKSMFLCMTKYEMEKPGGIPCGYQVKMYPVEWI